MEGEPLQKRSYNHVAFKVSDSEFDEYVSRIKNLDLDIKPDRNRMSKEARSIYFYDYDIIFLNFIQEHLMRGCYIIPRYKSSNTPNKPIAKLRLILLCTFLSWKKQIAILIKYAFFPLKMYLLKQVLLKSCMWSTGGWADRKNFPCVLVQHSFVLTPGQVSFNHGVVTPVRVDLCPVESFFSVTQD